MQVRPEPDEGWQHPRLQPACPVLEQPEQEEAAEEHVEQLGARPPGGRTGQRADQGQHDRRRLRQPGPAQQQVEADRGRRHHPRVDGNQQR